MSKKKRRTFYQEANVERWILDTLAAWKKQGARVWDSDLVNAAVIAFADLPPEEQKGWILKLQPPGLNNVNPPLVPMQELAVAEAELAALNDEQKQADTQPGSKSA